VQETPCVGFIFCPGVADPWGRELRILETKKGHDRKTPISNVTMGKDYHVPECRALVRDWLYICFLFGMSPVRRLLYLQLAPAWFTCAMALRRVAIYAIISPFPGIPIEPSQKRRCCPTSYTPSRPPHIIQARTILLHGRACRLRTNKEAPAPTLMPQPSRPTPDDEHRRVRKKAEEKQFT